MTALSATTVSATTVSATRLSAAARSAGALPLWAVCALVFLGILGIALIALIAPDSAARRRAKRERLGELRRYRLLGAGGGEAVTSAASEPQRAAASAAAVLGLMDRAVRARGNRGRLVSQLERSGLRMKPEEWAALQVSVIVAAAAVGLFLTGSVIGAVAGGPLGWLACRLFMARSISRRAKAFEQGLPDALQLVAGALRSGFALNQSIGAVAREGAEPVAGEFSRVLQEVRLGAELEDALDDLAVRMKSYDLELVVMAIRTAREIGGNLAEVLNTTVTTMRERVQLRGQIRVLSAEGRFAAKVLTGLPLLMALYLLTFRKGYLEPMYTSGMGIVILAVGSLMLIVGSFWLNRLTKIEV